MRGGAAVDAGWSLGRSADRSGPARSDMLLLLLLLRRRRR